MEFLSPDQHNEKGYCFQCSLVQCSQTAPQDVWIRGPSFHLSRIKWIQLTSGSSEDDRQYSKFCRGNKNNDPSVFHSAIYVNENDQTQYTIEFLSTINASSFHIVPWLLVATSAFREHLNIKNVYPKSPIRSWYHQLVGRKQLLRSYHASFLWQTPLIIASKPFYTPMSYTERLQDALAFCWFFVDLMFFWLVKCMCLLRTSPPLECCWQSSPQPKTVRGVRRFSFLRCCWRTSVADLAKGWPSVGSRNPTSRTTSEWLASGWSVSDGLCYVCIHIIIGKKTQSRIQNGVEHRNLTMWLVDENWCWFWAGNVYPIVVKTWVHGFMFLHEEAFFGQIGFGGFDIPVASIVDPHYPFLLILNPPFP